MNTTNTLKNTTTSILNSSAFPQIINKLSGDNLTTIILSAIAAGAICYVCNNGGCLEITAGDKRVVLSSSERAA